MIVDVEGHELVIPEEGAPTAVHPESDIENCGFDAYVASDWSDPASIFRPSVVAFTRHTNTETGQIYWNGSQKG